MIKQAITTIVITIIMICSINVDASMIDGDVSLMEIGSASSINLSAASPLQEIAHLLVSANDNIRRLNQSRRPFNVVANHIKVRRTTNVRLPMPPPPPPAQHVTAELIASMQQPVIHDSERSGTKFPIKTGHQWVSAAIVGEDGKPYVPRKQSGVEDDPETFPSPFAKYIHPPSVGSSADVVNKDGNTNLTPVELKAVNGLQLRLKSMLSQLGNNMIWDHSSVKNRRVLSEFEALKQESRTLMEEYELRTGVKTIAWQLQDPDIKGLHVPTGSVKDIYFGKNPELAQRLLQRGRQRGPPVPTGAELARLKLEHAIATNSVPVKPQEQRVDVAWKKQADGVVKAKVNLNVIDSKVPLVDQPPALHARAPQPGKTYASGKVGSISSPVNIDVVAPANEMLLRNKMNAASAAEVAQQEKENSPDYKPPVEEVRVKEAPKINL